MRNIFIFTIFVTSNTLAYTQISVPKVFSDHMVLQRELDIPIWGKSKSAIKIKVVLDNNSVTTQVQDAGDWNVHLPLMVAGGPYELQIFENENTKPSLSFHDVMIGDVWLASGQSNMEWQVQQSNNASEEIKNANFSNIRFFNVPQKKSILPQEDISNGQWAICDSNSVKTISAVAYFFAKELHRDIHVPIGILQSTWGGTPVEAWTSREMLLSSPISRDRMQQNDAISESHFANDSLDLIRFWEIVYHPQNNTDQTIPKINFDDSQWSEMIMPKTFIDWEMPFYEGIVWMRKTIVLPENMTKKDLTIYLGHPEMNYSLYINGHEICKNIWNANKTHHYTLPANMLQKGDNVISVRLAVLWGGGGFNPPADQMYITDGKSNISIAGKWKYQKDLESKIPKIVYYHQYPTYLYNAMIHPIIPYGIKGFIWYQGENNASNASEYQTLFPMMISDWRMRWQQGYLPFLFVQLANFNAPLDSDWPALREAQYMTLTQPHTAMVCTIDIGAADDIHPKNKQEVGHRLALAALKNVYGQKDRIASGPTFKDLLIKGNSIQIQFDNTGSGLVIRNSADLKGFLICGQDKKFHTASAVIEGDKIILSSQEVQLPIAARYAWSDNPDGNLINKEGLPAVPFRSDK